MKLLAVAVAATALLAGRQAPAALLMSDNFDSYADQAAFEASPWNQVGAVAWGTLSTAQSASTPNSINFATTAQRAERAFTESGNPSASNIIRFSVDFYDNDAAAAPYRQHHNLQDGTAPSGSGQLISLGLSNNLSSTAEGGNYYMARILGFNSSAYFKLNDAAAPLRSTGWHNLRVDISDTNFTFYVDGVLSRTVPNTYTLRSYDVVRIGSGLSSTQQSFVDNVLVSAVPEPASFALAGLAGLAVTALRRRVS